MQTVLQFKELFPKAIDPEGWVAAMNEQFPDYQVVTPMRIAAFVSQCGHESAGWTRFEENMNYSAKRLLQVFPKYFTPELAKKYERKPELIANRVYGGRIGNGPEESGDGWRFHGRGPIQLTGRDNYTAFAKASFENWQNIVEHPESLLHDKKIGIRCALWFWNTRKCNRMADVGDIVALTKRINGGTHGLAERKRLFDRALAVYG